MSVFSLLFGPEFNYSSSVANATATRQPLAHPFRSMYSLTVGGSYCPAPKVTLGPPCACGPLAWSSVYRFGLVSKSIWNSVPDSDSATD